MKDLNQQLEILTNGKMRGNVKQMIESEIMQEHLQQFEQLQKMCESAQKEVQKGTAQ